MLALGLLWLCSQPAAAGSRISIGSLQAPGVSAEAIELRVQGAGQARTLELSVARLRAAVWEWSGLHWRCPIVSGGEGLSCDGPARAQGGDLGRLVMRWNAGFSAGMRAQGGRIDLAWNTADRLEVRMQRMPLAWLLPLLEQALPELSTGSGTLQGELSWDGAADALTVRARLREAGLDARDGSVGAAGLEAGLSIDVTGLAGPRMQVAGELRADAGEVLYASLYAALAKGSVLRWRLQQSPAASWDLPLLEWSDPEGLHMQATAGFDSARDPMLGEWQLRAEVPDLQRSAARYLDSVLATAGVPEARWQGSSRIEAQGRGAALERLHLRLQGLGFEEPRKRLVVEGLQGEVEWGLQQELRPGALGWTRLRSIGTEFGAGSLALQSAAGELRLAQPWTAAVFGGELELQELAWRPAERRLRLGIDLRGLGLAEISARFGWPVLPGQLSGHLPGIRYEDSVLASDGALRMALLGGEVVLDQLRFERPFAVAPSFAADVDIRDIELAPLTRIFGFGEISGRLDGQIHALRMVGWSPVAFDARFATDPDYPGKQRISQRAVQDLSNVGGGLAAGLQNQVLKVFDSFAYKRIGLSCLLRNNVCVMGGLDSSPSGYTVVEGAGLPRITVNGFQRRVDWPVLVARLKAATSGQALRVE